MAAAPADAVARDSTVQEAAAAAAANAAPSSARPQTLESVTAEASAAALEAGLGASGIRSGAGGGRMPGGGMMGPPGKALAGGANAAMPITGDGLLHLATNHTAVSILFCDIQVREWKPGAGCMTVSQPRVKGERGRGSEWKGVGRVQGGRQAGARVSRAQATGVLGRGA